jgi:hypothetical protein
MSDKMVTPLSEIGNDEFRVKTFKKFIDNWICMNGRRPDRIDLIQYCFDAGWDAASADKSELKAELELVKSVAEELNSAFQDLIEELDEAGISHPSMDKAHEALHSFFKNYWRGSGGLA